MGQKLSKRISLIRPQTIVHWLKTASWIGVICPSEFAFTDMMVQTIHRFQKYMLNSLEFALFDIQLICHRSHRMYIRCLVRIHIHSTGPDSSVGGVIAPVNGRSRVRSRAATCQSR